MGTGDATICRLTRENETLEQISCLENDCGRMTTISAITPSADFASEISQQHGKPHSTGPLPITHQAWRGLAKPIESQISDFCRYIIP
jgi:hypothetical protein